MALNIVGSFMNSSQSKKQWSSVPLPTRTRPERTQAARNCASMAALRQPTRQTDLLLLATCCPTFCSRPAIRVDSTGQTAQLALLTRSGRLRTVGFGWPATDVKNVEWLHDRNSHYMSERN
jgi:hypothetical protein